ncbi:MAG: SDR family NAD(P)-dependent oxidoreductase [Pseudomonadota bacterium]
MTTSQDTISFEGQAAIVTGGGNGLGRAYCLELAARGAKVLVNDLGSSISGDGSSTQHAETVAEEIRSKGGEAIAAAADVTDKEAVAAMAQQAKDAFGRIDILIASAGIIRDKSFGKMPLDQFDMVADVDTKGAAYCSHAVWPIMKDQGYGRIVYTTSGSAVFGNFGQANYAAGKLGVLGLLQVLKIEGARSNIHVNAIAPAAHTRMSDAYLMDKLKPLYGPEKVAALAMYLASADAPNGDIISAGGGFYGLVQFMEAEGAILDDPTPEKIRDSWGAVSDMSAAQYHFDLASEQNSIVRRVCAKAGVDIDV